MTQQETSTEILVVGGGLGGVAAAYSACELGRKVILTEETDWIGGQLTSQAVPPDESPWIEHTGATGGYRRLRNGIREYYRRNYPLLPEPRMDPLLNPGKGNVSKLCHEPRVALAVMYEMLSPYLANGQLDIWLNTIATGVSENGDHVSAVDLLRKDTGKTTTVSATYIIDATELGDLLEHSSIEQVMGAEAKSDTNELHALDVADPMDQQAISWCFAVSNHEGENWVIDKPRDYDFWRDYQADFWPNKQLSWEDVHPITLETRHRAIFRFPEHEEDRPFWLYRRIVNAAYYPEGFTDDVTLVNWPQMDYWLGPVVGVDEETKAKNLESSRQLSLSLLYWMQTEAPRHDGGVGYPGLKIRPDLLGTEDGLAKYAYIRESRRIKAEFTVLEEHVGFEQREQMGLPLEAADFDDSVGIGFYRIDLHPSTGLRTYVDIASFPFQIPLGSLIPQRVENLIPANKNIGTTHITNGCYRLHPVEWNIGEAAGALAAWSIDKGTTPRSVRNNEPELREFQGMLESKLRIPLKWPTHQVNHTLRWGHGHSSQSQAR